MELNYPIWRERVLHTHATSRASVTKAPPEGDARVELTAFHDMFCGTPVNCTRQKPHLANKLPHDVVRSARNGTACNQCDREVSKRTGGSGHEWRELIIHVLVREN